MPLIPKSSLPEQMEKEKQEDNLLTNLGHP